jgi:hypothetical protein
LKNDNHLWERGHKLAPFLFFFVLTDGEVFAEPEKKLSGSDIQILLSDRTYVADGGIEQIFQASGQTVYTVKGAVSQGQWRVEGDKYCSVWPPSEHWACYDMTQSGAVITFISSSGTRYPMTEKTVTE